MQDIQNIPSPDVNSVGVNEDFGSHSNIEQSPDTDDREIQKGYGKDDLPPVVPPDQQPVVPIEDPPGSNEPPIGDVDDSPARLAGH
jgi:hypothetical protein